MRWSFLFFQVISLRSNEVDGSSTLQGGVKEGDFSLTKVRDALRAGLASAKL
jgi:hypothetical protein